jgi:lysyl endopeptidase
VLKLSIRTVAHGYRSLPSLANWSSGAEECQISTACDLASSLSTEENGIVRIMVDDATRSCTGVLLNNTGHQDTPYIVTSSSALMGDPSSFTFTFQNENYTCNGPASFNGYVVSGAELVEESTSAGLVLLKLLVTPRFEWSTYYCGWDRSPKVPVDYSCIHHPYGAPKRVALGRQALAYQNWKGQNAIAVDGWDDGITSPGSLGAPMFNKYGHVVGFFIGGFGSCAENSQDFFIPLSAAWKDFGEFLDPAELGSSSLQGQSPVSEPVDQRIVENNISFFPNPASSFINLKNTNEEPVLMVKFYNSHGELVSVQEPDKRQLNVADLPSGMYVIELILDSFTLQSKLFVIH